MQLLPQTSLDWQWLKGFLAAIKDTIYLARSIQSLGGEFWMLTVDWTLFEMTKTPHGWHFSKHFTASAPGSLFYLFPAQGFPPGWLGVAILIYESVWGGGWAGRWGLRGDRGVKGTGELEDTICIASVQRKGASGQSLKRRHDEFSPRSPALPYLPSVLRLLSRF